MESVHSGEMAQSVTLEVEVSTLQSGARISCGLIRSSASHVDQARAEGMMKEHKRRMRVGWCVMNFDWL